MENVLELIENYREDSRQQPGNIDLLSDYQDGIIDAYLEMEGTDEFIANIFKQADFNDSDIEFMIDKLKAVQPCVQ
ncbi:hypothetical protein [Halobacillus naozhouensis]|uniref:Phage protein n=1 Tax=Halobacillus naozhouensis TaxID=554880 RepID=A0ABY8IZT2_9BACI|nr:hypothetical protein [Halobacillus naozhouensis]WFT74877.1 hypothetical protein P9989_00105 [Halobacillus naozhouensis]